ncbi:hypothetical protein [Tsuneonella sp. HG222]
MPEVRDFTAILSGSIHGQTNTGAFVTFSFPTAPPPDYHGQLPAALLQTFRAFTEAEKEIVRSALNQWGSISGLTLFEVPEGLGEIRFGIYDLSTLAAGTAGFGSIPFGIGDGFTSDVLFHLAGPNPFLALHEIGHALGLKHPEEGNVVLAQDLRHVGSTVLSNRFLDGQSGTSLGPLDRDAIIHLYGGASADGTQVASWNWNPNTFVLTQTGNELANKIVGSGSRDVINGLGGDDILYGKDGDDAIDGGSGRDTVYAGTGNDLVKGGSDDDTILGWTGNDTIEGDEGNDYLIGSEGIDRIAGGEGNDRLLGEAGDDFLEGGEGNDYLYGRNEMPLRGGTSLPLAGIDFLSGGGGDDRIYATDFDTVSGGDGNDIVFLEMKNAVALPSADGGFGTDQLVLTFLQTSYFEFTSTDLSKVSGFESLEILALNAGLYLDFRAFVPFLNSISIETGNSDDVLILNTATEGFVRTMGGSDRIVFLSPQVGSQRGVNIADFERDKDKIDLSNLEGSVSLQVNEGTTSVIVTNGSKEFWFIVFAAIDMSDIIAPKVSLVGMNGDDNLQGTATADALWGFDGNDVLAGGAGDDFLRGGLGSDALNGGPGTDTAIYDNEQGGVFVNLSLGRGYGNSSFGDTYESVENITGTAFIDFLIGDPSVNAIDGGGGNDTIIGGLGPDVLTGGSGDDLLSYEDNSGTVFINLLTGAGFNNAAQGDVYKGFENVIGGLFDDTLIGDHRANRIDGALGADTLVGNGGADTFVFRFAPSAPNTFENPFAGLNIDTIFDFTQGEDLLEISAVAFGGGLVAGSVGASAFVLGASALDGNDRFIYDQANGRLYFDPDGNGSAAQVLMALMPNHNAIAATDFIVV